jgi:glycogen operon protein
MFARRRRRPWASVNFVAAHDGYTLEDTVSYEMRHNEANSEDNRDGHSDNHSRNWGAEGPTDDETINETRQAVKRAMLATLLTSHGTPMLLSGDEEGRTQQGNNNAYCQDNAISWHDWARSSAPENERLRQFTSRLIAARRLHPTLRSTSFLYAKDEPLPGVRDAAWFDENGNELTSDNWNDPAARLLSLRRACEKEVTLLLINGTMEDRIFRLPQPDFQWQLVFDTGEPEAQPRRVESNEIQLRQLSVVLLAAPP